MMLRFAVRATGALALATLAGCSILPSSLSSLSLPSFLGGSADKPKPAELQPNPALLAVSPAWTARIGQVGFPLSVNTNGGSLTVASGDGTVAVIDPATGRDVWRASVGAPIAAGAGSDGKLVAVITSANELVAISSGKEAWRQKLSAVGYTAPFVAGGRVFVLAHSYGAACGLEARFPYLERPVVDLAASLSPEWYAILRDMWELGDRELEKTMMWMVDALIDASLREGKK